MFPGLYAPLTVEGTIVVNGVLASCYASIEHDMAHLILKPMHFFPGMIKWIFAEDNGFSIMLKFVLNHMGRLMLPVGIYQHAI